MTTTHLTVNDIPMVILLPQIIDFVESLNQPEEELFVVVQEGGNHYFLISIPEKTSLVYFENQKKDLLAKLTTLPLEELRPVPPEEGRIERYLDIIRNA